MSIHLRSIAHPEYKHGSRFFMRGTNMKQHIKSLDETIHGPCVEKNITRSTSGDTTGLTFSLSSCCWHFFSSVIFSLCTSLHLVGSHLCRREVLWQFQLFVIFDPSFFILASPSGGKRPMAVRRWKQQKWNTTSSVIYWVCVCEADRRAESSAHSQFLNVPFLYSTAKEIRTLFPSGSRDFLPLLAS